MQKGSLAVRKGYWTGRFIERALLPDGTKSVYNRRVILGPVAEMTEDEARKKLAPYLEAVNFGFKGMITKSKKLISSGDRGAIAELIVAADLMNRGYDVFRNLSPNGHIDLVAWKDDKLITVQVKKMRKPRGNSDKFMDGCDLLAVVSDMGKIAYHAASGSEPQFRTSETENVENAPNTPETIN